MGLAEIYGTYPLYLAIVCIYLSSVVAAAGGIGGGGVVMPLLLVAGDFSLHKAVILSQCTVFGNSLAQVVINFPRSHPSDKARPLIYYDVMVLLLPALLGGSSLGVMLAKIVPETVVLLLAVITLLYAIVRTSKKALKYYKSENESFSAKENMHTKLLAESPHSPTKMGQTEVFPEQVSVFPEEDLSVEGERRKYASFQSNSSQQSTQALEEAREKERRRLFTVSEDNSAERDAAREQEWMTFAASLHENDNERDPTKRQEAVKSTDTVLFNPLTLSLSSSRNIASSLQLAKFDSNNAYDAEEGRSTTNMRDSDFPVSQAFEQPVQHSQQKSESQDKESATRVLPTLSLYAIGLIWMLSLTLFLVMEYTSSSCSALYFGEMASFYPILFLVVLWALRHLKQTQPQKVLLQGDIDFSHPRKAAVIPGSGVCVGVLTSLLGIGGGELLGPLFLSFNMIPQVSTATTSAMSFLNSASNIAHYLVLGDLNIPLAVTFMFVGFAAGTTGRHTALMLSQKHGRVSILVFMLAAILCLSVVLLVYEATTKEIDFALHALC